MVFAMLGAARTSQRPIRYGSPHDYVFPTHRGPITCHHQGMRSLALYWLRKKLPVLLTEKQKDMGMVAVTAAFALFVWLSNLVAL